MRSSLLALALVSACAPKVPLQRLPTSTPVTTAIVVDASSSAGRLEAPPAVREALVEALTPRNLTLAEAPDGTLGGQRLTDLRLSELARQAPDAPLLLLVELSVRFFSQLDGRYRWEVGCALAARRADGATVKDTFEVPVVLLYDREREAAALSQAAGEVASRLGPLLDGLLVQPKPAQPAEPQRATNPPSATNTAPVE